jgi:hypothetical protein
MLTINGREYETLEFRKKEMNRAVNTVGLRFAHGYLAISDNYRIYCTASGKPLLKCRFQILEECVKFVEILDNVYQDYWEIWDAEPLADIINWCKYSVEEGDIINEMFQILNRLEVITFKDVKSAWDKAKKETQQWKIT